VPTIAVRHGADIDERRVSNGREPHPNPESEGPQGAAGLPRPAVGVPGGGGVYLRRTRWVCSFLFATHDSLLATARGRVRWPLVAGQRVKPIPCGVWGKRYIYPPVPYSAPTRTEKIFIPKVLAEMQHVGRSKTSHNGIITCTTTSYSRPLPPHAISPRVGPEVVGWTRPILPATLPWSKS
jgi:hypothetical protein